MRRIDAQPRTLNVVPVDLLEERGRAEAIAAARGEDLLRDRINRIATVAGLVVLVLFVARCLLGCAALERAAPGLAVAHDVARVGCAILEGTDGSSADVLARTAAMQRTVLEGEAERAKERGADAATIDGLVASVAVLARALERASAPVVEAAGNGPAKLPPCPVAPAPATT